MKLNYKTITKEITEKEWEAKHTKTLQKFPELLYSFEPSVLMEFMANDLIEEIEQDILKDLNKDETSVYFYKSHEQKKLNKKYSISLKFFYYNNFDKLDFSNYSNYENSLDFNDNTENKEHIKKVEKFLEDGYLLEETNAPISEGVKFKIVNDEKIYMFSEDEDDYDYDENFEETFEDLKGMVANEEKKIKIDDEFKVVKIEKVWKVKNAPITIKNFSKVFSSKIKSFKMAKDALYDLILDDELSKKFLKYNQNFFKAIASSIKEETKSLNNFELDDYTLNAEIKIHNEQINNDIKAFESDIKELKKSTKLSSDLIKDYEEEIKKLKLRKKSVSQNVPIEMRSEYLHKIFIKINKISVSEKEINSFKNRKNIFLEGYGNPLVNFDNEDLNEFLVDIKTGITIFKIYNKNPIEKKLQDFIDFFS